MNIDRLLILVLIIIFQSLSIKASTTNIVKKGVLDLREKNLDAMGEVGFDGEWEFYWNQLINPIDFKHQKFDSVKYLKVPTLWKNQEVNGIKLSSKGAATYRMVVLLNKPLGEMAIKIGSIGSAYKLFINGKEYSKAGEVSLNEHSAKPGYRPEVILFTPTSDTLEVIFHVSNYHYSKGGLWNNYYKIGTAKYISNTSNREIQLSLLMIGSILIFALYHLGLYFLNRNFRYTLYFSLFCLVIVIRILVVNEGFLLTLLPNFNWFALVKIEYETLTVGTIMFSTFIYKFFTQEYSKLFLYLNFFINGLLSLFILLFPPVVFTQYLLLFQLGLLIPALYILFVVIKALKMNRQSALTLLIGFVVFLFCLINDILYARRLVATMYLTSFGFIAFVFSQAYMLSVRFSSLLESAESLAVSLEKTNVNLELLVSKRASKIQEQNKLLKEQSDLILAKNNILEDQNFEIQSQRDHLEEQHAIAAAQKQQIISSIEYASRIQGAVLNSAKDFKTLFSNSFILYHPKDIVSGDFYWFKEVPLDGNVLKIVAVVDCTGHGVAGALMSILGTLMLDKVINEATKDIQAAEVLNNLRTEVKNTLTLNDDIFALKGSMDMALVIIDDRNKRVQFAGAYNTMYLVRRGQGSLAHEIEEFKGDNMSVGSSLATNESFTNYVMSVNKGDLIYLFTDGYYDQFGGSYGKKLLKKSFKNILLENSHLPLGEQNILLEKFLLEWRGNYKQVDDITVLGFKV